MTADQKLSLSTIGQIGLHSSDLNRSVECYRETLGVPFVAKFDPPGLAMFDCDGVLLMVSAVDVQRVHSFWCARGMWLGTTMGVNT